MGQSYRNWSAFLTPFRSEAREKELDTSARRFARGGHIWTACRPRFIAGLRRNECGMRLVAAQSADGIEIRGAIRRYQAGDRGDDQHPYRYGRKG
jgi:hypothetical protein